MNVDQLRKVTKLLADLFVIFLCAYLIWYIHSDPYALRPIVVSCGLVALPPDHPIVKNMIKQTEKNLPCRDPSFLLHPREHAKCMAQLEAYSRFVRAYLTVSEAIEGNLSEHTSNPLLARGK